MLTVKPNLAGDRRIDYSIRRRNGYDMTRRHDSFTQSFSPLGALQLSSTGTTLDRILRARCARYRPDLQGLILSSDITKD